MSSNEEDYYSCVNSDSSDRETLSVERETQIEVDVSNLSIKAPNQGQQDNKQSKYNESTPQTVIKPHVANAFRVAPISPTPYRNNANSPIGSNLRNTFRTRGTNFSRGSSSCRGNYQAIRPNYQTGYSFQPLNSVRPEYPRNNSNQEQQPGSIYNDQSYNKPTYNEPSRQTYNNQSYNQQSDSNGDENYNEEDDEYDESEIELGEMQEIMAKNKTYTEKMDMVAREIKHLTTPTFTMGGYNSLKRLKEHFDTDNRVDGELIADYMGYNSFADMCLNAPEIVDLHKWHYSDTGAVVGYQPAKIDKESAKFVNDKAIGARAREIRHDEIGRYIDEMVAKEILPTVRELDFKYRMCETMVKLNGMNESIDLGALKAGHQQLHNEVLNSKTHRYVYSLPTNHGFTDIQKQRLRIEMTIRPNAKNQGLVYRLRYPLSVIKDYHDRVRVEIKKKEARENAVKEELERIGYIKFTSQQPESHQNGRPSIYRPD